jgi:hypothetical protein
LLAKLGEVFVPIDPSRIRILGPLAAFAPGFADDLARQGYRSHAARKQMWLLAHLSLWLARARASVRPS